MTYIQASKDILKKFEGISLCPYFCSGNRLTIGYGHVILPEETFDVIKGKTLIHLSEHYLKSFSFIKDKANLFLKEVFKDLISLEEAEALLIKDIEKFNIGLSQILKIDLKDYEYSALLSMCFNIGLSAFKKSTLLKKINLGLISEAASEFERWVYANGNKNQGLVNRRLYEKDIFLGKKLLF